MPHFLRTHTTPVPEAGFFAQAEKRIGKAKISNEKYRKPIDKSYGIL
ncbi:MAG: hypothetical protein IKV57_05370 [Clostridia bacterium]|nr:hypothetical protein [Clostridia bacterium]